MINKLYDNLLDFIKNNYVFLIIVTLMLVASNIETGYSIYKPGGSINITNRINSTDKTYSSEGSFNMAYVGMVRGTVPFYLLAKILPSWDLVENSDITYTDSETINDSLKREHIYYDESISNAKYLAYTKSNTNFSVKKTTNYVIFISDKCTADIKIGDEILKYDGIEYTDLSALREYINNKEAGDKIEITVKRGNKEIKTSTEIYLEESYKLIGIGATTVNEYDADINIIINSKASESGPSGGLMLTLAIYNALVKDDITKGLKIVGTGSIDIDGNVGEIGGVKYKLSGAVKNKADLFIVPDANYKEALEYAKEQNYDILIIGVSTFDEALEVLKNLEG